MLPNVCSKPMAEVLGSPAFFFEEKLRRRETKKSIGWLFAESGEAYLERARQKQSWDKSNILSFISKRLWRDPPVISRKLPGRST